MRYILAGIMMFIAISGRSFGQERCDAYTGWEALADNATSHVIMFGEVHGTNETAEAMRGLICELVAREVPVRFGVETSYEQSTGLDEAFTWPVNKQAVLEAGPDMWPIHDGRSSQAVFDLLSALAKWRYEGADISIFAFDGGNGSRSTAMAREVDNAARGFSGAAILFAGDFHTVLNPPGSGGIGGSLASEVMVRPVIALKMRHLGGEIFASVSFGGQEALPQQVQWPARMPVDAPSKSFDLVPSRTQSGYFYVGRLTPSPPAFPDAQKR